MLASRRSSGSPQILSAFEFLQSMEDKDQVFTEAELQEASGWSPKTTKANISKKLKPYLIKIRDGFKCCGVRDLGRDGFIRICSQNSEIASNARKPFLIEEVEELVVKARESALAAVQHYNNPLTIFRTGNYLVLMIIAYTALFHAILRRDGIDYTQAKSDGTKKLTKDGEPYLWDALHSTKYYAEHYKHLYSEDPRFLTAVVSNLELLMPIRHQIEHRYMPELDIDVVGHCQSMLMNFERIITREFTSYYALNTSLNFALQISTTRHPENVRAIKRLQSESYKQVREHITRFHANLSDELLGHLAYEFRVWLVQKPANRERSADMSIEFVSIEELSEEQRKELQRSIVAIKSVPQDYAKFCNLWEKDIHAYLCNRIGPLIKYGDNFRRLVPKYIRDVRDAHGITSPSKMYYRPGNKEDSRAMYSLEFAEWIIKEYTKNPNFFYEAKLKLQKKAENKLVS
jgi:Protein of unknown function (DUF3644).